MWWMSCLDEVGLTEGEGGEVMGIPERNYSGVFHDYIIIAGYL